MSSITAALKKSQEVLQSMPNATPFEKVEAFMGYIKEMEDYHGHEASLIRMLKLESVSTKRTKENPNDSKTVYTMTVPEQFRNVTGALHGGAVALIFDICTSTVIPPCARDGFWDTGHVSRTLNCTYLRPVMVGEKIWIESEAVHLGKRLATLKGVIKNKDGKVCYTCDHQKAAAGPSSL